AAEHPDCKCIFLLSYNIKNFYLSNSILRFFELCNINLNNIYFIKSVKVISTLILPEPSYIPSLYYSDSYTKIFSIVSNNSKSEIDKLYNKIYFSRQKFNKCIESEIGGELFDNLFLNNGFKIIYPEKESLDNQIHYIKNLSQFAGISGTVIHNLIFSDKEIEVFIINKTFHINTLIFDLLKMKKILPIFVDSYATHYPVRIGSGPFLFVNNYLLHNLIRDYKLKNCDEKFLSENFISECVKRYEFTYHKIVYMQKILIDETEDKYNWQYFSPRYNNIWIKNYAKYELLDKEAYDTYSSYSDIYKSLLGKSD
ncbi:MAG: glycosyltransferase family 61 protein, partial [Desulfovibrio sp.]|nr:glycosyltransferase family 61 protein [Desulfovibrio sp.]